MIELFTFCPESIKDRTSRQESALHISVENKKIDAFKVLMDWIKHMDEKQILRWRDEKGNTVLHLATATDQSQLKKKSKLLWRSKLLVKQASGFKVRIIIQRPNKLLNSLASTIGS